MLTDDRSLEGLRTIRKQRSVSFASLAAVLCTLLAATSALALPLQTNDVLVRTPTGTAVVDAATGAVTGVLGNPALFTDEVAFDHFGNGFARQGSQNLRINTGDLSLTPQGFAFPDQIDAQGHLYADVGGSLVQIDPSTGLPGTTAPSGLVIGVNDPLTSFLPNGDLLTLDPSTATITLTDAITLDVSILTSGGLLTPSFPATGGVPLTPVAIDTAPDGTVFVQSLFVSVSSIGVLTRIDSTTGDQVRLGDAFSGTNVPVALGVDTNGDPHVLAGSFMLGESDVIRFDGVTGDQTLLGGGLLGTGVGLNLATIPEPGTAILLGLGLAGLGLRRRSVPVHRRSPGRPPR